MLPKIDPTATGAWKKLAAHYEATKYLHLRQLFAGDPERFRKFSQRFKEILVDYSKNRITAETLRLLRELAEACGLKDAIDRMFAGDRINETDLPWVVHWHSDVEPSKYRLSLRLAYPFYRIFERAVLERADAIIATSPVYRDSSRPLGPWLDKCRVVPLGLAPERLPEPRDGDAAGLWRGDGMRALAVGRLAYYKGFETLIRAALKVPGMELVIVGDGEVRRTLEAALEAAGRPTRIRLAGEVDDATLCRLMASCDLLCLPSRERTEAFGVVLLEAMRKTWMRVVWFLREAIPLFLLGTLVLFLAAKSGLLALAERALAPLLQGWLSLPAETTRVFILGFLRRDYGAAGLFALATAEPPALTVNQTVVALTVITLFVPCVANFLVIIKEQGLKRALAILGFVTPFSFLVGGLVNWTLRLLRIAL